VRLLPTLFCATIAIAGAVTETSASDRATAAVVVNAQFSARTSLKVSTRLLQFSVADPSQSATAAIDFSAGARTSSGSEVVLSIEAESAVDGPGGAADVETSVSFTGEGQGTLSGPMDTQAPAVAGRWSGSGRRTGRLVFSLRAGASGSYSLPVRLVLSTP
jgi:hypothetical protein